MSLTVYRLLATACLPGFCLLWTTNALSATQRDLDSHEHGASALDVVIDGNQIFIDFESPWMNLVGFEHQPATEDQLATMDSAMNLLKTEPDQILAFNAEANCSLMSTTVNSTVDVALVDHDDEHSAEHADEHHDEHGDEHSAEHADEHHDEHGDEHSAEHADDEHDEHGDEHSAEHEHDHQDTHSEVAASYEFTCSNIGELSELDVQMFSLWPGVEQITVQMAGPGGQALAGLNSAGTTINLGSVR